MQIHLFDCKSGSSLQAHLGKNRLSLCLLFLDNLRDTYWSAGVMYRLFDRAQNILTGRKTPNNQSLAQQRMIATPNMNRHPNEDSGSRVATEILTPGIADYAVNGAGPVVLGADSFPGELEPSAYSLDFAALEQLLSPGFALSDGHSQGLFADYTGSVMGEDLPINLYNV